MTKILIPTTPTDEHARAVACVASLKDFQTIRWFGEDSPSRDSIAMRFDMESGHSGFINIDDRTMDTTKIDVVWLRRPTPPRLPESIHREDRTTSATENMQFFRSQWYGLAPNASWINPFDAHLRAMSKLEQLRLAPEMGLQIPPTLVGNDSKAIAEFIRSNKPLGTIYKSFYPARWNLNDSRTAVLETSVITEDMLPHSAILQSTPGIYQRQVTKDFEIRATFFGAEEVTMEIYSQSHERGKNDWRSIPVDAIQAKQSLLPNNIRKACRRLMAEMGIIFACFDFIVTPEGEYVFLEVNEMGQFLWMDYLIPELCLLDLFLDFIRAPSFEFTAPNTSRNLNYRDVMKSKKYQSLYQQDEYRSKGHAQLLSTYGYMDRVS